jgi:hypothetical protein
VKECKEATEAKIFTTGKKKATFCDEFKVLACLRILGRNYVTASVRGELLGVAKTTFNNFFKLFLVSYSCTFHKKYVFIPEELGLNEVEKVYRNMGLPGCLMGVTNVPWGASSCPSE